MSHKKGYLGCSADRLEELLRRDYRLPSSIARLLDEWPALASFLGTRLLQGLSSLSFLLTYYTALLTCAFFQSIQITILYHCKEIQESAWPSLTLWFNIATFSWTRLHARRFVACSCLAWYVAESVLRRNIDVSALDCFHTSCDERQLH